jgi:hypothetical protein
VPRFVVLRFSLTARGVLSTRMDSAKIRIILIIAVWVIKTAMVNLSLPQ